MDFLDPKKFRRNQLMLLIGYGLIAIAITMATLVLLYQTNGFGVDKQGQIIQNGLVFVSSQPSGARVYLNGVQYKSDTNTRLVLPSGDYELKIAADGYRDWKRNITVDGGDVQHFDYPFLFPTTLSRLSRADFAVAPVFSSQSPDRRWIVIKPTNESGAFKLFDIRSPDKPVGSEISLDASVFTAGDGAQTWAAVEWSTDNRHVLLRHDYTVAGAPKHEYITLDRESPEESVNISKTIAVTEGEALSLFDKKADKFYAFDAAAGTLRTTSLNNSLDVQNLSHILAFKSYSDNTLVYVTTTPPSGKQPDGTVSLVLQQGAKTYKVRNLPAGAETYSLDIAQYSGEWYLIAGASNDTAVYLYRNLQDQPLTDANSMPKPWRRFALSNPTHVSFSATAQFILAESGQNFWIYDAENIKTYRYATTQPLDQPQTYAVWMDGSHLTYSSGGKQIVFDYDYQNLQTLQAALPAYRSAFDQGYEYVYNIASGPTADVPAALFATPLRVER